MSVLNSVSESQRSNRKDYRRLLNHLTNCFRHEALVGGDLEEDSESLIDDLGRGSIEDSPETIEYVNSFRNKVNLGQADRAEVQKVEV